MRRIALVAFATACLIAATLLPSCFSAAGNKGVGDANQARFTLTSNTASARADLSASADVRGQASARGTGDQSPVAVLGRNQVNPTSQQAVMAATQASGGPHSPNVSIPIQAAAQGSGWPLAWVMTILAICSVAGLYLWRRSAGRARDWREHAGYWHDRASTRQRQLYVLARSIQAQPPGSSRDALLATIKGSLTAAEKSDLDGLLLALSAPSYGPIG
jgi:hypothetical protein